MKEIKLKGAFLSLTNKCNLNCKYCYQNSSALTSTKNELKKEDWVNILKELKELKAKKICFVGGEPFLYKYFWEILEDTFKRGFKIKVFTNGTLLNKRNLKKIKEYNVKLSFNLNSQNYKVQEFYQGKGNWHKTVEAINKCKKQKIKFEIASPVTNKNLYDIEKLVDFCEGLGAKRIRLVPLVLSGRAITLKDDNPAKEHIRHLANRIKSKQNEIEVTFGCRNCEAGINYLTIQPNGDITPCSINKTKLGNVKNSTIKKVINKIKKTDFKRVCDEI